MKKKFAVFDIDGTLYRNSLFLDVVERLLREGAFSETDAAQHYAMKQLWHERAHAESYEDFIREVVRYTVASLKNCKVDDVERISKEVVTAQHKYVYTYTKNLISTLKDQSYFLIAISGSHSEVVDEFARMYNFDVWSSSLWERTKDGTAYTGKSTNAGRDKHELLKSLVATHQLSYTQSYGIGDSRGDISMLELVQHPIAFNPEAALLEVAKQKKWQIVIERKNTVYTLEPHDGHYILA